METLAALRGVVATLDWVDPPQLALSSDDLVAAVGAVGEGALRWIAGVTELGIADLLVGEDADALAPWPELRPLVHEHLVDVVRRLAEGDSPTVRDDVSEPALADIFARDVPLERVLDTVATLHNRCLTELIEHALRHNSDGAVISAIVGHITRITNRWTQAHAQAYVDESRRRMDSEHIRVRAAIEALVAGESLGPGDARVLGTPLAGWHVGCVVAALPGAALDQRSVDRFAASFAGAVGGTQLRYETARGQVWLWASGTRERRTPQGELVVAEPLVVGVGRRHVGPAGLRRTHLEAADAVRVARTMGGSGVFGIDDVALAAMLSADDERARWFVEQELPGLIGDDEQSRDLRTTLRTFYGERMRIAPAAERLFVHRNTLINRLDRVERLLGHSIAERTAEVQAALILHDILPRSTGA